MTNNERRERRYIRRQEKRKNKKRDKEPLSYEDVFSISNLNNSFYSCRQNTNWKASVQSFGTNLPVEIGNLNRELMDGTWKSAGFRHFIIKERGKQREIRSVTIGERVVQKCFCDNYLVDLLSSNLIYDNGASLKGKGTKFALLRLEKHLKDFYFRNGSNNGYVVVYDFSSYFANIDHDILYSITDKFMNDEIEPDMSRWKEFSRRRAYKYSKTVKIGLVAKYVAKSRTFWCHDYSTKVGNL